MLLGGTFGSLEGFGRSRALCSRWTGRGLTTPMKITNCVNRDRDSVVLLFGCENHPSRYQKCVSVDQKPISWHVKSNDPTIGRYPDPFGLVHVCVAWLDYVKDPAGWWCQSLSMFDFGVKPGRPYQTLIFSVIHIISEKWPHIYISWHIYPYHIHICELKCWNMLKSPRQVIDLSLRPGQVTSSALLPLCLGHWARPRIIRGVSKEWRSGGPDQSVCGTSESGIGLDVGYVTWWFSVCGGCREIVSAQSLWLITVKHIYIYYHFMNDWLLYRKQYIVWEWLR